MKTNKDIWTLSANFLSGEMIEPEKIKFRKMLQKNKSVRDEFDKIKISWDYLKDGKNVDSQASWEKLYARLENDNLIEGGNKRSLAPYRQIYRIAAIFIFLAISSFATIYILSDKNAAPKNFYSFNANESACSFTFPEGSRVLLNKDAVVYYSSDFNNNRKVKLKGEGFFEVMSDPDNAFQIETSRGIISVLGTRFNVKENLKEKTTEVFVESGKVKLNAFENSEGITLEKGEFGSSNGNSEIIGINKDINYLAWKTHEFQFSDQDLESVFEVLQDSYHVKIIVKDDSIKQFKMTSIYSQQSIDAIIKTISVAFNLDYKREKGKYVLSLK